MPKFTILLLTIYNHPHSGGISSHLNALKNGFENLKIKTEIMSANSLPKFLIFFIRFLYFLRKFAMSFFYPFYLKILKFIFTISIFIKYLKHKWNLINAQDPIALNCTKLIRFFYKPKIILTIHGILAAETLVDFGSKNVQVYNLLLKEEKNAYNLAQKIITVEKSRKEHVLKFIKEEKKIIIHQNFVNTSQFKKISSNYFLKKFSLPKSAQIILFPKRLVKTSGIEYFVSAALELLKNSNEYYFIILGKGYLLNETKKSIRRQRNILLHDPVPNQLMPYLFNSSYLVVMPTISIGNVKEGSSMAIIEAMACGTPVIATSVGGNVELIESGKTGLLIPEKNSSAISEAIIKLGQNRELKELISLNCRNFIIENFSHIKAAKNFLKIYFLE